jgi:carbon monoxide dehydrogenase subunit G
MRIENSFRVDLPVASAWTTLLDVPSLVPCMPGAELIAVEDARSYRGQVKVKLGPVAVAFQGRARLIEVNENERTVRVAASGTEAKGRGAAQAEVVFRLSPDGGGTRVDVASDLSLAGAVAQYGRAQGVIADVSQLMVDTFARNLGRKIAERQPNASASGAAGAVAPPASAISIPALLLALVRRWFVRLKEKRAS